MVKQRMFEEGRTTYVDEVFMPAQHSKNAAEVIEPVQTVEQFCNALNKHKAAFKGKGDGSIEVVTNEVFCDCGRQLNDEEQRDGCGDCR